MFVNDIFSKKLNEGSEPRFLDDDFYAYDPETKEIKDTWSHKSSGRRFAENRAREMGWSVVSGMRARSLDLHYPKKTVDEAGPFRSTEPKKPRKGSVADLAAKKRQEQERGRQPAEPRDQRVGVARVRKDLAEGVMDQIKNIYMMLVSDTPMGTPESEFLAHWQRIIQDELGKRIDIDTLAGLRDNFVGRYKSMSRRGDVGDWHREMGHDLEEGKDNTPPGSYAWKLGYKAGMKDTTNTKPVGSYAYKLGWQAAKKKKEQGVSEGSETNKYHVVVVGHKRSYDVWIDAKNEDVAIIRAQQYVTQEHNDTTKRAAVVDMKKGVAEAIPYALSAANAAAEYRRQGQAGGGYRGRIDIPVDSQEDYLAVGQALTKAARAAGQRIDYGLSDGVMSVFSDSMNADELDQFIDSVLDKGVAEGISVVDQDYDLDQIVLTIDIEGKQVSFTYTDYEEDFENAERRDVFDQLQEQPWYKGLDHPTKMEILDAAYRAIRGLEPQEYRPTVGDEPLDEDWKTVNRKDKTPGMSRKAVKAYRRENPGSKLQTAVTTKPSKLKKGSKSAKRRKSFCARMSGMKRAHAGAKTKRDPDSPINKALRRWNCESVQEMCDLVVIAEQRISAMREGGFDIPEIPRAPQPRPQPKEKTSEDASKYMDTKPSMVTAKQADELGAMARKAFRPDLNPDYYKDTEPTTKKRDWDYSDPDVQPIVKQWMDKNLIDRKPMTYQGVDEDFEDLDRFMKAKYGPKPSGGSGIKRGDYGQPGRSRGRKKGELSGAHHQGGGSDIPRNVDFGRTHSERSAGRRMPRFSDDYDSVKRSEVDEGSVQNKLHKHHQQLRKKRGAPDPEYYKELGQSYDIENDQERHARQAEIKKKYKVTNEDRERYIEELGRAGYEIVNERRMTCPECGGVAYADRMLAEKQDACYHKVKSRYKVWPSAYASGALVRCRKKGAANWGNKSKK